MLNLVLDTGDILLQKLLFLKTLYILYCLAFLVLWYCQMLLEALPDVVLSLCVTQGTNF